MFSTWLSRKLHAEAYEPPSGGLRFHRWPSFFIHHSHCRLKRIGRCSASQGHVVCGHGGPGNVVAFGPYHWPGYRGKKTDILDKLPRMEWQVADPGEYSVGFLYDFSSSGGVVMTYADN